MRIYELAKQFNVASKDIIDALEAGGFGTLAHMSVLSQDAIEYLNKNFLKTTPEPMEKIKNDSSSSKMVYRKQQEGVKPAPESVLGFREQKGVRPKPVVAQTPEKIVLESEMPLFKFAELVGRGVGDVILVLMKQGHVCNRNHVLTLEMMSSLARGFEVEVSVKQKVAAPSDSLRVATAGTSNRSPIVVVMGHVDHGKTTLLDFIRKTNVVQKEKGGITQHLGAYEVNSTHGKIVFLDTPGHEAFTQMRKHGVRVTDIAILVIAADDGMKPQTIEALNAAKNAQIPIIVAINKIDKVQGDAALETIRRQLAQHDLLPEAWGGTTICVPISAKTGQGVNELLEMIILQSQLMDLKASPQGAMKGFVLESNMEKGLGPVATVIVVDGTLQVGDSFLCGSGVGKVKVLLDSFGKKIKKAGPSTPVQVVGFDALAHSGDVLEVVSPQEYLRLKLVAPKNRQVDLPVIASNEKKEALNIILKTDTHGTREALLESFKKLSVHADAGKTIVLVSSGVGGVSEGDVALALNTNSLIIAMHVKVEKNAQLFAKEHGLTILQHNIIYHLLEELEAMLRKDKVVEITFKKVGEAEVIKVFDVKGTGVIAGSRVRSGIFSKDGKVVCVRMGKIVGEGAIASLQRDRKSVKEVHKDMEFAFISKGFQDWQLGDVVECLVASAGKKS
jgi:translation initiation factor IF-2